MSIESRTTSHLVVSPHLLGVDTLISSWLIPNKPLARGRIQIVSLKLTDTPCIRQSAFCGKRQPGINFASLPVDSDQSTVKVVSIVDLVGGSFELPQVISPFLSAQCKD